MRGELHLVRFVDVIWQLALGSLSTPGSTTVSVTLRSPSSLLGPLVGGSRLLSDLLSGSLDPVNLALVCDVKLIPHGTGGYFLERCLNLSCIDCVCEEGPGSVPL